MAYNPMYPMSYPSYQQPQQPTSSLIWVQGEAGAKSYLVGAGQSVLLMDSESSRFYIKSTDTSGMPMPLRVFEYEEKTQDGQSALSAQERQYVTHEEMKKWTEDEFRKWTDDLLSKFKREEV